MIETINRVVGRFAPLLPVINMIIKRCLWTFLDRLMALREGILCKSRTRTDFWGSQHVIMQKPEENSHSAYKMKSFTNSN